MNRSKSVEKIISHNTGNNLILFTTFENVIKLKKGGFGTVYRGNHILDNNSYAIKKVPIKSKNITSNLKFKLKEVRCLSKLNHDNIIRYHTSWLEEDDDNYNIFIQMELMDLSLSDYLIDNKPIHIRKNMFSILNKIVDGVKYLHNNNIVHCDLKPDNILINILDDNIKNVKVADFGLVFEKGKDKYITLDYGTSLYMAPIRCNTAKYDIYSLGIIFFEVYNGFSTYHEKYEKIELLKKNKYINEYPLIYKMINKDFVSRCDINYISEELLTFTNKTYS